MSGYIYSIDESTKKQDERYLVDDVVLVKAARDGDGEAYKVLYCRHKAMLTRFTQRTLGRNYGNDCEDVLEEAFYTTYAAIRTGNGPTENFLGYITTVIRNNVRKQQQVNIKTECREIYGKESIEDFDRSTQWGNYLHVNIYEGYERGMFDEVFSCLSEDDRWILWRRCVQKASYVELMVEREITLDDVRKNLERAKDRFRKVYFSYMNKKMKSDECKKVSSNLARKYVKQSDTDKLLGYMEHLNHCNVCQNVYNGQALFTEMD